MSRLILIAAAAGVLAAGAFVLPGAEAGRGAQAAIVSVYPSTRPRGVLATTGGWVYCRQLQALARSLRYTLVCGRYYRDGDVADGLRSRRFLDWGDPQYLASLAAHVRAVHRRVGGELVLLGVSYSGFGVATLASHHPELRPDRLIVVDSYLDLVARRAATRYGTGAEIDAATGGTAAALRARSVSVSGLAQLVRTGTKLTFVWSIAPAEAREFFGATCNRNASAAVLARLATVLGRPIPAWITWSRHGHDLWDHGPRVLAGNPTGNKVLFRPGAGIPAGSTCDGD